jgi:hypothetical protein
MLSKVNEIVYDGTPVYITRRYAPVVVEQLIEEIPELFEQDSEAGTVISGGIVITA